MRVIVTDHAMAQMRVRGFGKWVDAPAKEISEAVAGAVAMGRTRKVRDMGTAQLFTVVTLAEGRLCFLVREDSNHLVVVTVLTAGQFDKSCAIRKLVAEAA